MRGLASRTADQILKRREADTSSKLREKFVKDEIKKKVPVSRSVQSGILKTILGSYEDEEEDSSSGDESDHLDSASTNPTFKKQVKNLKSKSFKDGQNNEKGQGLEKEVENLRKELKELKEQFKDNQDWKSSNSSESESEEEKPVSVLDIFKTTILQKSKKSTYIINKEKRSKVSETRTQKILKERIEKLQKK